MKRVHYQIAFESNNTLPPNKTVFTLYLFISLIRLKL